MLVRRLRGAGPGIEERGLREGEEPGEEAAGPGAAERPEPREGERRGEPAERPDEGDDDVREAALEEGMGLGDVKMLAMVGAFLGPKPVLVTILAGSIVGCLVTIPWLLLTRRGFRTPIPFGPFLALGALVALFAGEELSAAYSGLILRLMG
jgi:prepilin signal peptidase PulO-like enzyme (type II secretory pathway)